MKLVNSRHWQGLFGVVLFIAALAVTGCIGTIHGGGVVSLVDVAIGAEYGGLKDGVLTDAKVAVSVICNDSRDEVRSIVHWTDNANNANFTALLPWTPLSEIEGAPATCEEAAEMVSVRGLSFTLGIINSRGQESGQMGVAVTPPGAGLFECGALQAVGIRATGTDEVLPGGAYEAEGCLDHGRISFQNL